MSTALAIASVTYVLKDLLNNGLIDHDITAVVGTSVAVTALPPDRIDTEPTKEQTQLNLFMYQATHNPGWRNMALPSHNAAGERTGAPPLALDLHYLLTAYGTDELHYEILLGYGMQLLHETPVLTRAAIGRSLMSPNTVPGDGIPNSLNDLSTSGLAEQVEQIKITPELLNTEEISKLWAAFGTKYRSTAAYKVTDVLIESNKSVKTAVPVKGRNVYAVPFKRPVIARIGSKVTATAITFNDQKIFSGNYLVLSGQDLKGDIVTITIDGIKVPGETYVTDTEIIFPLPAGLQAGIHGVQVVHERPMGSPPIGHAGVSSNIEAFVLSPQINNVHPTVINDMGDSLRSADISITVIPAVASTQRVILLLNELNAPVNRLPFSYSFQWPVVFSEIPLPPVTIISVPVSGVAMGTYLARIQVDGAESPLEMDDVTHYYSGPTLSIT